MTKRSETGIAQADRIALTPLRGLDDPLGDDFPDDVRLSPIPYALTCRVESCAHGAGSVVVEIGFAADELQNKPGYSNADIPVNWRCPDCGELSPNLGDVKGQAAAA